MKYLLLIIMFFITSCAEIQIEPKDISIKTIKFDRKMTTLEKKYFEGCSNKIVEIKKGLLHYIIVVCPDEIKFIPAIEARN